jgi:hypothetical protein
MIVPVPPITHPRLVDDERDPRYTYRGHAGGHTEAEGSTAVGRSAVLVLYDSRGRLQMHQKSYKHSYVA